MGIHSEWPGAGFAQFYGVLGDRSGHPRCVDGNTLRLGWMDLMGYM